MTDDAGSGECRCRFEIFPNSPIFSLQIVVDQLPPCVNNFAGSLWRSRSLPKGDDDGHHFDDHSSILFWGLEWMHGGWRWTVDGGFQVAAGCARWRRAADCCRVVESSSTWQGGSIIFLLWSPLWLLSSRLANCEQ